MSTTEVRSVLNSEQLSKAFAGNVRVLARQVNGLSHVDSLLQPPFRGNCLNWVLGHIAVHRDFILETLSEKKIFDEGAIQRYDRGSAPIVENGDEVLTLESILSGINESQKRIEDALARATLADLEREAPDSGPKSVAEHVCFLYWHETYHVGQTEFLRQLAGTDDHVI